MVMCLQKVFQSRDIRSKMPQCVRCCSFLKGNACFWKNTSDLNGHCGAVSESEGGLGEHRPDCSALWSRGAETGNDNKIHRRRNNGPSTNSAQRRRDKACTKEMLCFPLHHQRRPPPPHLRLAAGLSLSLPDTSLYTSTLTRHLPPSSVPVNSVRWVTACRRGTPPKASTGYFRTDNVSGFCSVLVICNRFEAVYLQILYIHLTVTV